jgi:hypothetical protein
MLASGVKGVFPMKKAALCGVAGVLVFAGMIRIDLIAQEPTEGRPKGYKSPEGENHRLLPVQTELQRLILGKDVSVFVTLDLTGVVKEGEPDRSALPRRVAGRTSCPGASLPRLQWLVRRG